MCITKCYHNTLLNYIVFLCVYVHRFRSKHARSTRVGYSFSIKSFKIESCARSHWRAATWKTGSQPNLLRAWGVDDGRH